MRSAGFKVQTFNKNYSKSLTLKQKLSKLFISPHTHGNILQKTRPVNEKLPEWSKKESVIY